MYHIAIIGKQDREIVKISQSLLNTGDFLTTLFYRPDLALQAIGRDEAEAWILAIDSAAHAHKNLILRIRELIGSRQLLILANYWDEGFEEFVESLEHTSIINRLNDRSSLAGVLLKMLKGDPVHSRNSVRKTPVETIGFRLNQKSVTVKDLSNTGARVLSLESNLRPGDKVSLEVNLPSVKAAHFVHAEVMWVLSVATDQYRLRDRQLAGVKFLYCERMSL